MDASGVSGQFLFDWSLIPLHDLWPHQCITLWSAVVRTKFGCHRAFLSNFTHGWHSVNPAWSLTPTMWNSSYQIWWPQDIPRQFDPWLTQTDPYLTCDPSNKLRSSWVLPTKFCGLVHPKQPVVAPRWSLHDLWFTIHYTSVRGSSCK